MSKNIYIENLNDGGVDAYNTLLFSASRHNINPTLLSRVENKDRDLIKNIFNNVIIKLFMITGKEPNTVDINSDEDEKYYCLIVKWNKPEKFIFTQTLFNDIEDINSRRIADIWCSIRVEYIEIGLKITKNSSNIRYTFGVRKKIIEQKTSNSLDNKGKKTNKLWSLAGYFNPFNNYSSSIDPEEKEEERTSKKRKK